VRYLRSVVDAYADVIFAPEPFTAVSVVQYFLDLSPGVASALRAARASFVMMPELLDLPWSTHLPERAPLELARAEELARSLAAWPLYVGTGRLSAVMTSLESTEGGELRGPPLTASPARGVFAGYVVMGEGGAMFYTASGLLAHTGTAQGVVLALLGRRLLPGSGG
jgi:hypothetical protein